MTGERSKPSAPNSRKASLPPALMNEPLFKTAKTPWLSCSFA